MLYIAHRANITGPNPELENHPDYIAEAINQGYDVEVDLWWIDNSYYLGHNSPQYQIDNNFLFKYRKELWCHAKHQNVLPHLLKDGMHCFFHQTDECVLTSNGFIWTYPNKCLISKTYSIAVIEKNISPSDFELLKNQCIGICSDYVKILNKI